LIGDGRVELHRVAPLDRAQPDELSLLASGRYAHLFSTSAAGAVLVAPEFAETPGGPSCRIVVEQPYDAILRVLPELYATDTQPSGVHPTAVIGRDVVLGRDVSIGAYSVIGDRAQLGDRVAVTSGCIVGSDVAIGEDSHLLPSVTVYPGVRVGRRVRLHAGVRLGCDGFGYVFRDGAHQKMPHVGRCIIEDDVEIGANSTIDRGSIDDTVIGAGTKLDNLVHVAHNVRIGRLCLIMAQVGIAGSVHIEDGCILAGQAGVSGHVTVGAGARLAAQAGVFGDIPAGETWSGYPARPHRESLRAHAAVFKLAGLIKRLERLVEADRR
jgi:UDP-3-O-[3-hydroxymyristoyl] glucosamine N-acyltransferase